MLTGFGLAGVLCTHQKRVFEPDGEGCGRSAMVVAVQRNEAARVAALQKYAILDSEPEQGFDDLTLLASWICRTPIALISLVDENRQWFKSKVGISVSETSRDIALCSTAIQQDDVFV